MFEKLKTFLYSVADKQIQKEKLELRKFIKMCKSKEITNNAQSFRVGKPKRSSAMNYTWCEAPLKSQELEALKRLRKLEEVEELNKKIFLGK